MTPTWYDEDEAGNDNTYIGIAGHQVNGGGFKRSADLNASIAFKKLTLVVRVQRAPSTSIAPVWRV